MSPLYVENGLLMERRQPIRELGINTPDLLIRCLGGPGGASIKSPWPLTSANSRYSIFRTLSDQGIRFVRFAPFGLRPLTFKSAFMESRQGFLNAFDALVAEAEHFSISLVPSLFFSQTQIPPIFNEPLAAFADPMSESASQFEEVIKTIVPRYKDSSAIAYWEFGNEQDSRLDMAKPNYSVDPSMGTPKEWTEADMTPRNYCNAVTRLFKEVVRKYDSEPVGGSQYPRLTASGLQGWRYFLSKRSDWKQTVDERLYDDQTDTVTVHPYPQLGWFDKDYSGLMIYLSMLREELRRQNRPLIVGEFGVQQPGDSGNSSLGNSAAQFEFVLRQIRDAKIQLAFLWNVPAARGTDSSWDFSPLGPHRNIWRKVQEYNASWRA